MPTQQELTIQQMLELLTKPGAPGTTVSPNRTLTPEELRALMLKAEEAKRKIESVPLLRTNADPTVMPAPPLATSPVAKLDAARPASPIPTTARAKEDYDSHLLSKVMRADRIDAIADDELNYIIQTDLAGPEYTWEAMQELRARKAGEKTPVRLAGQMVAGFKGLPGDFVGLGGLVMKGLEATRKLPLFNQEAPDSPEVASKQFSAGDAALAAAADMYQENLLNTGISAPRDVKETIAQIAGASVPIPFTGGVAATTRGGTQLVKPFLTNMLEVSTPLVVGNSAGRITTNVGVNFAMDQVFRETLDDAQTPYKTVFDAAGMSSLDGGKDRSYVDLFEASMPAIAGFTAFTFFAPLGLKVWKQKQAHSAPRVYEITETDPNAPKGLKSLETFWDAVNTYFLDDRSALYAMLRRAGASDPDAIERTVGANTGLQAQVKVNEAMITGTLITGTSTYHVPVTPEQVRAKYRQLEPQAQSDIDMYIKLLDQQEMAKYVISVSGSKKPTKKVRAAMAAITRANKEIAILRKRTPGLDMWAQQYADQGIAVRNFMGGGASAMLSKKQLQALEKTRPHFVPGQRNAVDPNDTFFGRLVDAARDTYRPELFRQLAITDDPAKLARVTNVFDSLVDYSRAGLLEKMKNDAAYAHLQGMMHSLYGGPTVRLRKASEKGEKHQAREVIVYEGGKRKVYLTSKLAADLLKFDPYVARYPYVYALKRMAEQTITGKPSLTFAPTSSIVDTIAGLVFTDRSKALPGTPGGLATSVPKQVWRKLQLDLIKELRGGMWWLGKDQKAKDTLADHIATNYMNSLYHMANTAGGTDASIMRTTMNQQRGVYGELLRSVREGTKKLPYMNTLGHSPLALLTGLFTHTFDAFLELPRFAGLERSVKAGMPIDQVVGEVRKMSGDTTSSGRVHTLAGKRMDPDVKPKGSKLALSILGEAVTVNRESILYFNPAVAGMRRMGQRLLEDPIGTNMKLWTYVGIPAMSILAWNEALGPEYNDYSFNLRPSSKIAMNFPVIGIPGLPPEQGIEIRIPHEVTMWNSPFTTAVYSMMRGDETGLTKKLIQHMMYTNMTAMSPVNTLPVPLSLGLSLLGKTTPQSFNIADWGQQIYNIKEDDIGVMDQNFEMALRTMFNNITDIAIPAIASFHDGGFQAFMDEMGHQLLRKVPIIKDITNKNVATTAFNPLSEIKREKIRSINEFMERYNDIRRQGKLSIDPPDETQGRLKDDADVYSTYKVGPPARNLPNNDIYMKYGEHVRDWLDRNDMGWAGLQQRGANLTKQVKTLKGYLSGRASEFREWQKTVEGADKKFQELYEAFRVQFPTDDVRGAKTAKKDLMASVGEAAKVERLLKTHKLDLGNRDDVQRFIGILEREQIQIMNEQLQLIGEVETMFTQRFRKMGVMGPKDKFDVLKHLDPALNLKIPDMPDDDRAATQQPQPGQFNTPLTMPPPAP